MFAVNALILVGDGLVLGLVPPIPSSPLASDALVVGAGLVLMLLLSYALMYKAFRPLDRLRSRVAQIDGLGDGQQLPDDCSTREVAELTAAFNAMLARLEDERRRSAGRTLAAQERERRRLSRDLHDEVGQTLSAALLLLTPGREPMPDEVRARLEEAAAAVREGLDSARRVAHELRPRVLDEIGLSSGLVSIARRMGGAAGIEVRDHVPPQLPSLPEEVELVVYRVAQEALTNVVRHAAATAVDLLVAADGDELTLTIRDDGCGSAPERGSGCGIDGMVERASDVGGSVLLRPAAGGGTEVELRVPLPRPEPVAA